MLILSTALIYLGTATALLILLAIRPKFRLGWLLAAGGAAVGFGSVILWLPRLPHSAEILLWQSTNSPNSFAAFAASPASWPYALSLACLALVVILTAPSRANFQRPFNWILVFVIVAVSLLAATAKGPLTLVLFWAALDLAEAGIVLARRADQSIDGRLPLSFSVRLGSIGLVLLGLVLGDAGASGSGFAEIQGAGLWLLPVAALVRILSFGTAGVTGSSSDRRDEVGIALELSGGVAAVAFLSQLTASNGGGIPLAQVLAAAVALYASWMWLRAPDLSSGRPYWIMAAGSLAVAAIFRGNASGATAWGCYMLLAGSALFLRALNDPLLGRGILAFAWVGSALPFSLTASAWMGGGGLQDLFLAAYIAAQAMLGAGFIHMALRSREEILPAPVARSSRGVHRAAIGLPLLVALLLGVWGWTGALQIGAPVLGAVAVSAGAGFALAKRRLAALSPVPGRWMPAAPRRILESVLEDILRPRNQLQRAVQGITRTMEGEAGILWSLVLLVLFVSVIVERGR